MRVFDGVCEKLPECVLSVCDVNVCPCVCLVVLFFFFFYRGPVQEGRFEGGQTAAFYCPRGQ